MKKLVVMPISPVVHELVRRLEQASIQATLTSDSTVASIFAGAAGNAIVWIADNNDHDLAIRILRELRQESTQSECPHCGYDLQGHDGKVTCPECGRGMTAACGDVTCRNCGELVPANFALCWNCGREARST